jgi:hypothetical protein
VGFFSHLISDRAGDDQIVVLSFLGFLRASLLADEGQALI